MQRIGIIGAGAWGTALAAAVRRAGREVVLWALEAEVVESINGRHVNGLYLPDAPLDPAIVATQDLIRAADADVILLVVPAQHLRAVAGKLAAHVHSDLPVVICAKGIEQGTGALMTEAADSLTNATLMVLSGPSFAGEVAKGLPTALTLATADPGRGRVVAEAIGSRTLRPYLSSDLIGAQVGGAVKNVLAIACGICEGRNLGANARAALLTRGIAEIVRFAVARGGQRETLMGLSGLGDLVLTATSMQSRNFSLGVALGQGRTLAEVLGARRSVTEGVTTASAVVGLAAQLKVDMPICAAVDKILSHDAAIDAVLMALLDRPLKDEIRS
ncbi:MAG: NAD(P)-dependent glycerol-3-phosphate dehydrogenase [Rhodospirillaceae bacterium]|nr:MAG: NAD(P)-dependent glycerol-3-phosphate dehydrogenase [Rhodospirillaceae bacterium]